MILDEKISVKINSTTLKYYNQKGYIGKIGDIIIVKVEDLPNSSFYEVNVKCDICDKEKKLKYYCYLKNIKNHNFYCCCNKCAHIKNKKTNLEKYGNKNYNNLEKIKSTNFEKYGVENVFQSEDIKNKIKSTNIDKYGFESHNKSNIVEKHKETTFLEKYGTKCLLNTDEQKEKTKIKKLEKYGNLNNHGKIVKTNLEKHGFEHPSMIEEFLNKRINNYKKTIKLNIINEYKNIGMIDADFDNDIFIFLCDNGHTFEINRSTMKNRLIYKTKLCSICNPIGKHISGQEIILSEYIKEIYKDEIIFNSKKIIPPYELDIYLPKLNLAFEYNGVYWHNESHKDKFYHFNKTDSCEKLNIKLIHIYEDDWLNNQSIIKSMIFNLIKKYDKINIENIVIKEINNVENFLNENNIQGYIKSDINIGLFENDNLINILCFNKIKNNSYELITFCNNLNYNSLYNYIHIFNYFINKYKPNIIYSITERNWFNKEVYENLNFKLMNIKEPILQNRNNYKIYNSENLEFLWQNN